MRQMSPNRPPAQPRVEPNGKADQNPEAVLLVNRETFRQYFLLANQHRIGQLAPQEIEHLFLLHWGTLEEAAGGQAQEDNEQG